MLDRNPISDLTPLSNLVNLRILRLDGCINIADISPLENLVNLERLFIQQTPVTNFTPLQGLNLIEFYYDEPCNMPPIHPPIRHRIENRNFPSVFSAWGGIGWSSVKNLPYLSDEEHLAFHDLYWSPGFGLRWRETKQGIELAGNLEEARQQHDALLALNPEMLFILEIRMEDASIDYFYHEDWPYWIRDSAGNRALGGLPDEGFYLIDFTHPGLQEIIVQQAIAVAKCGLYDGIFFDGWNENHAKLVDNKVDWFEGYRGFEAEQRARDNIIQGIRAEVRDDFLILVNTNRTEIPRTGPYINGTFMETGRDYDRGYTHAGLIEIESTLFWAEKNLREPQINALEGWGVEIESPNSPTNRRWMRVFTTMGLTHSDGYVLYITGIHSPNHEHDWSTFEPTHTEIHNRGITHGHGHDHYWYNFWDVDLGKPIGRKAQPHQDISGLFTREFTNGWAVYNRSGAAQTITLPASATPVSDRGNNAASLTHLLPDLDGEIYLKGPNTADVNGDGRINILDLVQVANGFGKSAPDPNGDGVVNILDLVFVTQQFSQ